MKRMNNMWGVGGDSDSDSDSGDDEVGSPAHVDSP
jgi:hypothetical protein